jgi:DNA-binding transcriptional regulator YbjK
MAELSPRRQELMAAATRVTADQGLRGLTHRAVDREAGLSEGSCSAYYRTRQALQLGLAEHVAGTLTEDVVALAAELQDCGPHEEQKTELTSQLILRWVRERHLLLARLELGLASARDPELAALMAEWRHRLVGVVASIIEARGHEEAEERAEILVAALDGVLLAALVRPARGRRAYVTGALQRLMSGLTDDVG